MADGTAVKPISHVLIETLLDWPVLLFLLLVVLLYRGRAEIIELLRNRRFEVSLGGTKISIGDAVEVLNTETKQALDDFRKNQDEIAALQEAVTALQARASESVPRTRSKASKDAPGDPAAAPPPSPEPAAAAGGNRRPGSYQHMLKSITESSFEWRSLERLAIEARISESEARAILADHADQIVLGKDKAGKALARLKRAGDG